MYRDIVTVCDVTSPPPRLLMQMMVGACARQHPFPRWDEVLISFGTNCQASCRTSRDHESVCSSWVDLTRTR